MFFSLSFQVRYVDDSSLRLVSKLLASELARPASAENLLSLIVKNLEEHSIPFGNIMSLTSDYPNVMRGKHSVVFKRLQEKAPHILDTGGCHLHHVHNSSAAAMKMVKEPVHGFLTELLAFFKYSAERRAAFVASQELLGIETQKLLALSSTRWLCIKAVITRTLAQFPALLHYLENLPSQQQAIRKIQR